MPNNQEDLNRKLNYLNETKQEIKRSLKAKGQPVNDNTTFREYANLVNNITTGTDTDDADATPNDILSPKTAYVNGQKIIGAIIPKYDKYYSGELTKHDLNLNELLINNVFCVLPDDIFIVYIDLSDGFKIKVIDSNTSALSEKNITDYAGTESEIPITMKCSNLEDSDGCYNLCLMTRQNKSVFTYIFKLDKSTGSLSSNYSRRTSAYQYIYAPLNCCFANKSANIVTWVGSEDPNNVAIYRINKDCSITAVTYMPGQTDFYWIGAVEFSPDDKYICYNNSHAQDYGCAIMAKLSNNYTYEATLKFQAFTVWVIINASYLVEITNKSAKLYRYSVKSNKINLTYINDVADTPLTEMGKHFTQVSVLANGYYAIQRSEIIYIYKFDENSETVSLVQTIEGFTSSTLNSYSIQYNKDSIISVYTIPHTSYLYSLTKDSEVFYNTKYGSITDDKVLSGYIYFNSNGMLIGTMPNNGTLNITPGIEDKTIPLGYTDGGTVNGDENLVPENIIEGKTIFGVTGNATGSQLRFVQRNIEYPEESNVEINVYDSAHNKIDLLGNNSYLINTNPIYIQIEQNGYKYDEQEKSITVNSYIDAQIPGLTNILTDDYQNSNLNLTGTINNQSPSYSSSGTLTFNTIKDYKGLYTNGSSYITYNLNTSISSYDVQFDFYKANTASYSRVCLIQGPNYEIEIKGSSNNIYWNGELSGGWLQNQWNTLRLHKSGNNVQLYINNKLIATKTYSAAITGIRFGRGNDSGNYFTGYYKNIVITDNNKTPEQPIITITPMGDTIDIIPKDIEQQVAIPQGTIQANVSAIDVTQTQYYEECLELSNQILGITNN